MKGNGEVLWTPKGIVQTIQEKAVLGNGQQILEANRRGRKFGQPLVPGQIRGKVLMLEESLGSRPRVASKNKSHCFESGAGGFPKDGDKLSGSKNSSTYLRKHFLKRERSSDNQPVHPSQGSSVNKADVTAPCFVLILTEKQKGRQRETGRGRVCQKLLQASFVWAGMDCALDFKYMTPPDFLWRVWNPHIYSWCL